MQIYETHLVAIARPDSACKCCIWGVALCAVSGNSGLPESNFEKALATIFRTQKTLHYLACIYWKKI